jgi:hypothetical protein
VYLTFTSSLPIKNKESPIDAVFAPGGTTAHTVPESVDPAVIWPDSLRFRTRLLLAEFPMVTSKVLYLLRELCFTGMRDENQIASSCSVSDLCDLEVQSSKCSESLY